MMNNRKNTHIRYRKSVYRKNGIKIALLFSAICLLLVFILFLVFGNMLLNRSEEDNTPPTDTAAQNDNTTKKNAKSVNALPISLSDSSSTLASRVLAARSSGASDICFALNNPDGSLLYSSPLAQGLGRQTEDNALWTLDGASEIFRNNGMYSVGITHIKELLSNDDLARTAALGYYASISAEALRSGIDDVLIFAGELPPERYGELVTLAAEVHRLCPDGILGLSLPPSLFSGEHDALINELYSSFDYIAVNLTSPPNEQTDIVAYADTALGGILYYLLRYDARVLIPSTNDENITASLVSTVKAKGTENIQRMP